MLMIALLLCLTGLDLPADVSAKLPKRSCLRHIKNLARSLHDPGDILVQHKAAACLIINGNIDSICKLNYVSPLMFINSSL